MSINFYSNRFLKYLTICFFLSFSISEINKINKQIGTKCVINTNYCEISICESSNKDKIIILSAIDNLIKGGAGQAIQNLNIKFGFNLGEGLN